MSMIKRLFGSASKPDVPAQPRPSQIDSAPDSRTFHLDNAQAATRRELVRVMTRDTLRATGIPEGWIECHVLLELARDGQTFVHLRLVVKHWDVRLLQYTIAFQHLLMAEITRFDPAAQEWLLSISWQYQSGDSCPFPDMPDPQLWQAPPVAIGPAPAMTSVDLALDMEEPDEVSEDLARLFAIRDANLPATRGN